VGAEHRMSGGQAKAKAKTDQRPSEGRIRGRAEYQLSESTKNFQLRLEDQKEVNVGLEQRGPQTQVHPV
jgi:hypothetical protein